MTVISSRAGRSEYGGQLGEVSGIRFSRASFGLYVPKDLSLDSLMGIGPHAIVLPNGVSKTEATVTFSANVKNSGNASGSILVVLDVYIAGIIFGGTVSGVKTIAPGASTTTGLLTFLLKQSDPAGAITAKAILKASPSMAVIQTLDSPGLGSIESGASFTLDILGGGWTVS